MNKLLYVFAMSCLWVFPVMGMTVEELFSKMKAKSEAEPQIGYDVKYSLYKSYDSQQVHSSYDGYLYQQKGLVYQKIKQTEFVNAREMTLKINHEEKLIQIDPAQAASALNFNPQEALKLCARKNLEETTDGYLVTLEYSASSVSPFAKVVLRVSKKSLFMQRIELYYKTEQDFAAFGERADRSKPKLVITISNVNNQKERSDLLIVNKYVVLDKNKALPASAYSGYQIIDNRIN